MTVNPSDPQANCDRCMQILTRHDRQLIGCGFEPPPNPEFVDFVRVWDPPRSRIGFEGPELTTCPGYTTSLPEVHEVIEARVHWTKGQLDLFCDEKPTKQLLQSIVILEAEANRFQNWVSTKASEGGGRE